MIREKKTLWYCNKLEQDVGLPPTGRYKLLLHYDRYYKLCLQLICEQFAILSNVVLSNSTPLCLYTSSNNIFDLLSHFSPDSYGVQPAATPAASVPGATGQVSPCGHLQGQCTASGLQHHLLPRCMQQALCHQERKRSVTRFQSLVFT